MSIDPRLLELLICPACRHPGRLRPRTTGLACEGCGRVYPIREDGFPAVIVEDATTDDAA